MKKFLLALLVICSALSAKAYAADNKNDAVRVGLCYGSSAVSSVLIEGTGLCFGYSDGEFVREGEWEDKEVTITALGADVLCVNSEIPVDVSSKEFAMCPSEGYISVNGSAYRGYIILKPDSSNMLTVINCLSLEEYLYGVIGSEMPSSWHPEALKAQAVCARGFAISNMQKHASEGFNLCSTTNCQVYKGVSAETPSVIKAADETAGQVLMYDGSVAQTLFFSCSGGHTADVKNVWGSDIAYLRGVDDPYESGADAPLHSWSATLTNENIKQALADIEVDIGDITGLEPSIDDSQRVYELKITGTSGEYTLKRLNTCSVFASYGLRSNKYTITPYGTDTSVYAISSSGIREIQQRYAVGSGGEVSLLTQNPAALSSAGKTTLAASSPRGYVFNGGGWGHGVGMSQYGAKGMAENGYTYDRILYHYYPGTYLE